MEGLDDLEFLSEYREDNRIEAKRAQGGLPHSLWADFPSDSNQEFAREMRSVFR